MNVRGAVEKRDQVVAAERAKPTVAQVVRQMIEAQSPAFRTVLPRHVDPDRFSRLTLAAVKASPELMRCFDTDSGQTSVLLAAMQAAAVGLEPNTPTQDAWILPRKIKGTWEAQLMIGYRGLLKLARRSGNIKTVFAEVVREGDHFVWGHGLESDTLDHRPGGSGDLTHVYAVARYMNGGYNFVVLNREQVEARRAMSDSWKSTTARPYSPWSKWPEAMWKKSALRALVPFLDLSPQEERGVALDERPLRFDSDAGEISGGDWPELAAGDTGPVEPVDAEVEAERLGTPGTVGELEQLVRSPSAIVAACRERFPDRAGDLADLAGVHGDPEALDYAMSIIEHGGRA